MKRPDLTKSRFRVGHTCPTKLFYTDKTKEGFRNTKSDDDFLKSLADGGFQVGELAKVYFHKNSHDIDTLDKTEALRQTQELLKKDEVTIFEAAFRHEHLFIRADIVIKKGRHIRLIEVKAKSYESENHGGFMTKKGVDSKWEPYLIDVAFQKHVIQLNHPDWNIVSSLFLADKSKTADVNGLNQNFFLQKTGEGVRSKVIVKEGLSAKDLGAPILSECNVDEEVNFLLSATYLEDKSFGEYVTYLAEALKSDEKVSPVLDRSCKKCEFRLYDKNPGEKSGFAECWARAVKSEELLYDKSFIFDVWYIHYKKQEKLLENGVYLMSELEEDDLGGKDYEAGDFEIVEAPMNRGQRQWLQVKKVKEQDKEPYLDASAFLRCTKSFKYPLHFIDFETTRVAIPFYKGARPYEQIAFQFSHHQLDKDGKITHQNQFIHMKQGEFPNFEFVRALKAAIGGDQGTIFRYSNHENTVLKEISVQLGNSSEADKAELQEFIASITDDAPRTMVDLCEIIQGYYYHPLTQGSNSIKKVLPAVLNTSEFLREKYSRAIYGKGQEINSLNLAEPHAWLKLDDKGQVLDPYKSLKPVFADYSSEYFENREDEELADGGAAMTAYARMQFTQMPEIERQAIKEALLRYCELDTIAMVMIYEHLISEAKKKVGKKAA